MWQYVKNIVVAFRPYLEDAAIATGAFLIGRAVGYAAGRAGANEAEIKRRLADAIHKSVENNGGVGKLGKGDDNNYKGDDNNDDEGDDDDDNDEVEDDDDNDEVEEQAPPVEKAKRQRYPKKTIEKV